MATKTSTKTDVYERVTQRVLDMIEEGTVPWHKPWAVSIPRSMSTGKPYRGINVFLLDGGYWGTFKKIKELGGQVRKGERSSVAVFWKFIETTDANGVEKKIPMLRHFNVFHSSQADWPEGMPEKFQPKKGEACESERREAADEMVQQYLANGGPTLAHQGEQAFYRPPTDEVVMPSLESFDSTDHYYSTLFHELGHSTGAASRLNREGVVNLDMFGSHQYAREELVAEMTAAMVSASVGIDSTIATSAAYLANWRDRIASDNRLIVKAAGEAQRAADMIQGITWEKDDD